MSASPLPSFVHLRLHSEYSITDGLTRIDEAIAQAAADGQPALAITDLANLFGMVKFYTAARGKGIKPIIGCDVWIGDEDAADKQRRSRAPAAAGEESRRLPAPVRAAFRRLSGAAPPRPRRNHPHPTCARATTAA
jgi:hypothetical protein